MADKSIQQQIAEAQLEREQILLEQTREQSAAYKAGKFQKARVNAQRQEQLAIDVRNRRAVSKQCNHRQGGTTRNPYKGKGKTSLNRVLLPDGFSKLIMCSICRLRLFSPFPLNKTPRPKRTATGVETSAQAAARVRKFHEDEKQFNKLWEDAEDSLTPEASQVMHCGVTFTVTDPDGMPIMKPRPCDTYALQMA
jgi:hypothetical protein